MNSRYSATGPEAEFEHASRGRVLRNKLGIHRVREMQAIESSALERAQERLLERFSGDHRFTAADICGIHRDWLGDIYEWAGAYRSVNVSKGGLMFAAAGLVPGLMAGFERGELRALTPCQGMPVEALIAALARTHAELVIIHPFREGNGRCARLLALLMALQAGLPLLDFGPLAGRGRAAYFAAIRAAFVKDYRPLEARFRAVIDRTLRPYARRS